MTDPAQQVGISGDFIELLAQSEDVAAPQLGRVRIFNKAGVGLQTITPNADEAGPVMGTPTIGEEQGAHSFQTVPADLVLLPLAGSDDGGNPKYLAGVMGNVLADDALLNAANYLGGVIGAYSIPGAKATTYPAGAVLAQISDGVTDVDGAVVAYIDGDGDVTTAGAAYKVRCNNSTPGSGFDFGLDLQDAAHDGYLPVDSAFYKKAQARLTEDVCVLVVTGTPSNGTTGANVCGPGSLCVSTSTKKLYINTNTKASPTWTVVGTQS